MTRGLAKSPEGRYRTCGEFVDSLEQSISGHTIAGHTIAGHIIASRTMRSREFCPAQPAAARKSPILPILAAGLGTLLLAAAGLVIWKPWVRRGTPEIDRHGCAGRTGDNGACGRADSSGVRHPGRAGRRAD